MICFSQIDGKDYGVLWDDRYDPTMTEIPKDIEEILEEAESEYLHALAQLQFRIQFKYSNKLGYRIPEISPTIDSLWYS